MRLQGLQVLSTSYPGDSATAAALRHCLTDEQAEVRLHAAIALGAEGRASLLDLARHERTDDIIAAQAIGALGNDMPADVGVQVLRQALRSRRLRTCVACVHALEPLGGPEAREILVKMLARESGELAVAAAQALGRSADGAAEVEEALTRALERDEADVRLAAIEALGHMGSARAVLPIQEAATNGDRRDAARRAPGGGGDPVAAAGGVGRAAVDRRGRRRPAQPRRRRSAGAAVDAGARRGATTPLIARAAGLGQAA